MLKNFSCSNLLQQASLIQKQIACDVIDNSIPRDIYGNVTSAGELVNNPVPYSFTLHEIRNKHLPYTPPKTSPFYVEQMYEVSKIMSDQRLVVRSKVRSLIENYHEIHKPIIIAKFEESPYFLVCDGNHRLAAARLLGIQYISAYLVDVRESFR